jgi:hypothetical protein
VSFSSNDLIGHVWGPDSPEVLDVTLRTDKLISKFLTLLDDRVGPGNYLVCVTADHGACPRPSVAREMGKLNPKRLKPTEFMTRSAEYLKNQYPDGPASPIIGLEDSKKKMWDELFEGWIYLDDGWKDKKPEAAQKLANWLRGDPDVWAAYSAQELESELQKVEAQPKDPVRRQAALSYFAKRCGDVIIIPRPFCFFAADPVLNERRQYPKDGIAYTTTHGTPHPYDTHVPLLVFGSGVIAKPHAERVNPLATAAILAHALGVNPPEGAVPCPAGLFDKSK